MLSGARVTGQVWALGRGVPARRWRQIHYLLNSCPCWGPAEGLGLLRGAVMVPREKLA